MKLLYSFFLLAVVSLLMKNIPAPRQPLFSVSEMREINRRLDSVVNLKV